MKEREYTVDSNILGVLSDLGIEYTVKGNTAKLKKHDSLSIQLSGQFEGYWMRWSTGDGGRGVKELIQYLIQIGSLDYRDVKSHDLSVTKSVKIKKTDPFNYHTMVTNPITEIAEGYLVNQRKLSRNLVKRMIELGKIVQDGRNNIRFLWESGNGNFTGGDVQGTKYSDKFDRGYLKHALTGSKGLFNVQDGKIIAPSDIRNVYIFEAPIDLLSYLDLSINFDKKREEYNEVIPNLKPGWMAISLSGSKSKLLGALQCLQKDFGVKLEEISFVIATDSDEAGDDVYTAIKELGYKAERIVPNNRNNHPDNQFKPIKDWNDLLKIIKSYQN